MAKKRALRLREVVVASAAGMLTVRTDPVPADEIWCIQHLTVEGSLAPASGNTRSRVYIDRQGYRHYLAEQDAPAANTLYWLDDPVWLIPGERIAAEWDQAQNTTRLEMIGTGYTTDAVEGVV